jgi:hypothetical protein
MKIAEKKSYVYLYLLDQLPIYIGIGTEDSNGFQRALDFRGHPALASDEYERITVEIIHRNINRGTARRIEASLIQVVGLTHKLRNKQTSFQGNRLQTIQLGKVDERTLEKKIKELLETNSELLIDEALEFFDNTGIAIHGAMYLYPEPVDRTARTLQQAIIPSYDPDLDSMLGEFGTWCKDNDFIPFCDKVIVIVPTEVLREKFQKATKHMLFLNDERKPAVIVSSLELWARNSLTHPGFRKVLAAAGKGI